MEIFRSKIVIYGLAACVIAAGVYLYISREDSSALLMATETTTGTAGSNLVAALSNLQGVKLNNAIFSDPVFRGLSDFGAAIPAQPIGRNNPFAPLAPGTSPAASSVDVREVLSL